MWLACVLLFLCSSAKVAIATTSLSRSLRDATSATTPAVSTPVTVTTSAQTASTTQSMVSPLPSIFPHSTPSLSSSNGWPDMPDAINRHRPQEEGSPLIKFTFPMIFMLVALVCFLLLVLLAGIICICEFFLPRALYHVSVICRCNNISWVQILQSYSRVSARSCPLLLHMLPRWLPLWSLFAIKYSTLFYAPVHWSWNLDNWPAAIIVHVSQIQTSWVGLYTQNRRTCTLHKFLSIYTGYI